MCGRDVCSFTLARAGWDRGKQGKKIGTASLCRPTSTPRCREMPTLYWSSVGSFGFAQERVSRLLHDVSEELSVIR
jgi:hypothetical protein